MLDDRIKPDEFTMAGVLSACAQLGSLEQARKVHSFIIQHRIRKNHFVLNGLVDMFAKCDDLAFARKIFDTHAMEEYRMLELDDLCTFHPWIEHRGY
ncbi:hypothetical protein OsI_36021 [Oryza sativa Indica Group]|uniref:Pentatricopeptide repeat-containing protein n=1 Tax=Oryza sativa subsp. indica TaxID=39946 RepID=B8BKD1_ORYSI|nr:hypothetical protein OsI_36021 [Oryza sativa Indica Group]